MCNYDNMMSEEDINEVEDILFAILMADFFFSGLLCCIGHEFLSPNWGFALLFCPTILILVIFPLYVIWEGNRLMEERSNEI